MGRMDLNHKYGNGLGYNLAKSIKAGFATVFERRFMGLRMIEAIGLVMALVLIIWMMISNVHQGEDVKRIAELKAQIAQETQAVTALKIKVARLERPTRLENLAQSVLNMRIVNPDHEADLDSIVEISGTEAKGAAKGATKIVKKTANPTPMQGQDSAQTPDGLTIEVVDPHSGVRGRK